MAAAAGTRSVRTGILASRVTGGLLLALVLLTVVVPRFTAIPYHRVGAIASFAGLLVLAVVAGRRGPSISETSARRLALPLAALCTLVTAFVGYASYYVTTWDSKLIQNI